MSNYNVPVMFWTKDGMSDALQGCCERHGGLIADHAIGVAVSTMETENPVVYPTQRFGVVLTVDEASAERGVEFRPDIVAALYDEFHRLMVGMCGEPAVKMAMLSKLMRSLVEDAERDVGPMEILPFPHRDYNPREN